MYRTLQFGGAALLLCSLVASASAGMADDQYAIAAHHYTNSRWDLAVAEFQRFLEEHPQHERAASVRFFLAESYVQVSEFRQAHQQYHAYLQQSPRGQYAQQSQFRAGETLYLAGEYDRSERYLQQFVRKYPDDSLCQFAFPYLGEVALFANRPEEARHCFEQGLQKFPQGPLVQECRFGLARALEALGETESAIRFYQFVGESEHRSTMSDDALLQMAILLYQQKHFDEAITALRRQQQEYPGSELAAHAAYWLGLSQSSAGQMRDAADTLAAGAVEFADHSLAAAMAYGAAEANRQVQDLEQARAQYERVLTQYPNSDWADDSLQSLVQLCWQKGDEAQTLKLADLFAKQYPDSPRSTFVKQIAARTCLKLSQYDRAIELLEPCLEAICDDLVVANETPKADAMPIPTDIACNASAAETLIATRYYLALALLGTERHADAIRQLDQLVDVQEPLELVGGIHVARASALLGLERYAEAVKEFHLYLTNHPDGPDVGKCRIQLAVTLARLQRWKEGARVF